MFGLSEKQTSLITVLSSEHGQMRRQQRDISMRDLQKALKHGTRTRTWGDRWKIEYDGIVFITDATQRCEITSYPAPLAEAPLDLAQRQDHEKARHVLLHKPEMSSTHTVLVVDNSGSMAIHDIDLYRCRQTAAYTMTALEFIAEQMFNGTANNRDLFSLVEFSQTATVVLTREPVSWVLYNKLLARRDSRTYEERERAKRSDLQGSNSNYMPALDQAENLLAMGNHETCALNLYFLSDGAPTDARSHGYTPEAMKRKLMDRMETIATRFGKQLNVQLVGFGSRLSDFSTLESMAHAVNVALGDAKANFFYCDKMANQIRNTASSLIASSTLTRTALMEDAAAARMGGGGTSRRTIRNVVSENDPTEKSFWRYFPIVDHFQYNPVHRDFAHYPGLPFGCLRDENKNEAISYRRNPPPYLAIQSGHCGRGAERLAFRCRLVNSASSTNFVLGAMVAKETKLVERTEENVAFHKGFCETQDLANHLAQEFNVRLRALPEYNRYTTPLITFLPCSVLLLRDNQWPNGERGVLVEKMLDTDKFQWKKWNDNAGSVNGVAAPMDVDMELAKIQHGIGALSLGAIGEEEEEEESDDEDSDDEEGDGHFFQDSNRAGASHYIEPMNASTTRTEDDPSKYLQAFTHFTYLHTNKKVMVCDLQGIYNTDTVPPRFELSDPAIHYASKKGRVMVFGRTDKGKEGIQLFFNTHKCNSVCKYLQLSKKNKKWRKDWHRNFGNMRPHNHY